MLSKFYILENSVKEKINVKDFSGALDAVKDFVESVMHSHKAPGEIVGSKRLDNLCGTIGKSFFDFYFKKWENVTLETNRKKILILCTGLYKYGGTSLVVADIIRSHKEAESTVVLTNLLNDMGSEDISLSRIGNVNADVVTAPKGSSAEKLKWLIEKIIEVEPSRIFLFNHHQDSVIISAMQPFVDKINVIFYHHADHNLCLGVHLENATHIDPHNVGYFNCREGEKISDNFYLPLTVDDDTKTRNEEKFLVNGELITCSSATFHKFNIFYLYSYVEFIVDRLAITSGVHYHIGNIPKNMMPVIEEKLLEKKINKNRFIHIPWVPSLWQALVENKVDLFICSFPLGGARTSIEAMGAGIPMITHENYLSRFHSSRDIVYPDAPVWKYPEEFSKILSTLTDVFLIDQSRKSRNHYVLNYSSKTIDIAENIENICTGKPSVQPPRLYPYQPDTLDRVLHFSQLDSVVVNSLVNRYENSMSWKLTSFLRFFNTRIRKILNR
jgi:hypothetical protein